MHYLRHYYIFPYDEALSTTLQNEYSVSVEARVNAATGAVNAMTFDISDLHPQIARLNVILPAATSLQLKERFAHDQVTPENLVMITYIPQYTKEECANAKWLYARNTSSKILPVNCESIDTQRCHVKLSKIGMPLGRHEVQTEHYVIKSPIRWGRSAFVSAYAHEERLFCNRATRKILSSSKLNGIQFLPVMKKATGQPMDDVYQIGIQHMVPDGAIGAISGMEDFVCDQCGMHMLRWGDGRSRFGLLNNSLDERIDLWQTQPMYLGPAPTEALGAQRCLIISQRMYRVLTENKLDRGFVFAPLELIDT